MTTTLSDFVIAEVAHEANRAYCAALGDLTQPAWCDAPQWQMDSAMAGMRFHRSGDHGPEASHEAWMRHKQANGWVYGETKDPDAKTHPCLLPFDELPLEQQRKDRLFRAIVRALME